MSRRKVSTTIYITPEQDHAIKVLSKRTRVPVASFVRDGIDHVLERYAVLLSTPTAAEEPTR